MLLARGTKTPPRFALSQCVVSTQTMPCDFFVPAVNKKKSRNVSGCGGWCYRRVAVHAACACAACPMRNTGMNRGFCTSGQNACCDNTAYGIPCRAGWLFKGSWLQLSPLLHGQVRGSSCGLLMVADLVRQNRKPKTQPAHNCRYCLIVWITLL